MIDGVKIVDLKQIIDERGKVMHMLRMDAPHFREFGEVYFSVVNPGAIKAWKLHKRMTLNCAVPVGQVRFVLYDEREASPTHGQFQEILLGPDNYKLLVVPPLVWNGFKGIGQIPALVANCASILHDPAEIERKDPIDPAIAYDWDRSRDR